MSEIEELGQNRDGELSPEIAAAAAWAARALSEDKSPTRDCCVPPRVLQGFQSWLRGLRRSPESIESALFEDQAGNQITFAEFFRGQPTVVVFFYTRCDKPQRCSLSIAKLACVQKLLAEKNLAERIHTAAITYDPAFDSPARLQSYGQSRGLRFDLGHRMLRAQCGFDAVKNYFRLGVNFIQSLVNKHRVEVYVLDAQGSVAASFQRVQWDERRVADEAVALLEEEKEAVDFVAKKSPAPRIVRSAGFVTFTSIVALLTAFFPKCPVCWLAYLSVFGLAGFQWLQFKPWLLPLLVCLMVLNLGALWWRGRSQKRMAGFYLCAGGSAVILVLGMGLEVHLASRFGVLLNMIGAALSALQVTSPPNASTGSVKFPLPRASAKGL